MGLGWEASQRVLAAAPIEIQERKCQQVFLKRGVGPAVVSRTPPASPSPTAGPWHSLERLPPETCLARRHAWTKPTQNPPVWTGTSSVAPPRSKVPGVCAPLSEPGGLAALFTYLLPFWHQQWSACLCFTQVCGSWNHLGKVQGEPGERRGRQSPERSFVWGRQQVVPIQRVWAPRTRLLLLSGASCS